jgi:tetratricopeptide (TPR) repeat protein
VGRERELAELVSACEAGADSDAHLFLLYGEPGIGKTRLADELVARVKAGGLQVLWGQCWEGHGAPAYWPWIQVIRSFLGTLDPQRLSNLAVESEIASDIIHQVAQIIPDLRPAHSTPRPSLGDKLEPSEARFRLFDAVTNLLKIGARSHPMLIVLDDLHDADEASLALLHFIARELKGASILLVATYRDVEVRRSPTLSKVIGELSRDARSIPVSGLRESEVTKLIKFRAGQTPDDALVAKLCAATNGNPLFVDGIIRSLISEGSIGTSGALDRRFKIPSGVREAIRVRLDCLSAESKSMLAVAAAIGNEFEFNLCQSVADVSADEAHHLLDEAAGAGIVTELGRGRYRFSHALIREVLYEELDTSGRVRIHGKIAYRLEEAYREDIEPHLPKLAHHFREASVTEKAIDYSVRAGQAAAAVLAYTDAMVQLQAALEFTERGGSDMLRRADLLHWLGKIAFQVDRAASLAYGKAAISLYESIGRFDQAAIVHTLLGLIYHYRGEQLFNAALASDHLHRAELELTKGPETIALADLYRATSANECHLLNVKRTAWAARRSMEISVRLGDKYVWSGAAAFYAWTLVMDGKLKKGLALFNDAVQAAIEVTYTAYTAAWGAGECFVWLGDPRGAHGRYELELNRISKELAPLNHRWLSRLRDEAQFNEGNLRRIQESFGSEDLTVRFWIAGEWEMAAALMEKEAEELQTTGELHKALYRSLSAGQAYLLFLADYARAERLFKHGLNEGDLGSIVLLEMRARPWLARVYVAMNRLDAASEQVARCRHIMAAGEYWRGLAGDVVRAEAIVAAARGSYDFAYRQFESALAIHQRYLLAWEEADTLQCWGRALGAAGDRTRAAEKFDAAIDIYRSRGASTRFADFVLADKMCSLGGSSHPKQQAESEVTGTFLVEGEFWTIGYRGTSFRLKNAKGLHYLAYLLADPGKRIHVHDLIEAVEGSGANRRTTIHAESEDLEIVREIAGSQPTIDARSRSEYRARLRELQSQLDEAERMNDLGRTERLRTEIEMVGQELTGSSGFGGRARAASGSAERARVLIGKSIRSVVEKIRRQHPALGRHLGITIRTGYFCTYQADPDQISWQL